MQTLLGTFSTVSECEGSPQTMMATTNILRELH